MKINLIAPCGMNCGLCYAYQREKNKCSGCRCDFNLPNSCQRCSIKNCDFLKENKSTYCYDCEKFPCLRLKQLDKRYKTKYHMSMIDNLNQIKEKGINYFLIKEEKKWKCSNCGYIIYVHHNLSKKCPIEYQIDLKENL